VLIEESVVYLPKRKKLNMYTNNNTDGGQAFQSANNSNFQMDVNGFRISVAFGPGTYVNDRNLRHGMSYDEPMKNHIWTTDSAEVMIVDREGNPIKWGFNDVVGFCSSDTVARFIGCLVSCPQGEDPTEALNQINNAQD
jgi:hypothetical protein